MYKLAMGLILTLIASTEEAPSGTVAASGAAEISGRRFPISLYFENGTIGVEFFGFKASAGLGGLLTGNAADGGIHAEAETPFGQSAGAGIFGNVNENGENRGYKYSYARNNFTRL